MTRPHILYIYDTLCGWCFGFAPVVDRLLAEYADRMDFAIYSGGLAIGDQAQPVAARAGYILPALRTVEQHTGVRFGEAFVQVLQTGTYMYDSLPPAQALAVYRRLVADPVQHFAFGHALHHAIFVDGADLNRPEVLADLAVQHGADEAAFRAQLASPQATALAEADFALARELGVSGYPAMLVRIGAQTFRLSSGYQPYEQLQPVMAQVLAVAAQAPAAN